MNKYVLTWLPILAILVLLLANGFAGQQARQNRTLRDCSGCPEMIVIPPGSFTIGSPANENDRSDDEGPRKEVHIRRFAVSKYDITRGQWAKFVAATRRDTVQGCA
jgi:formylglycine-generating enzyme required for sulfatase activity